MKKRRTKGGTPRMKENGFHRIELWLDEALFNRLGQLAQVENMTKARLVKQCVDNWAWDYRFLSNRQLADLAKDELNNVR